MASGTLQKPSTLRAPNYGSPTTIATTATSFSYTATEDCWIFIEAQSVPSDSYLIIQVDNLIVDIVSRFETRLLLPVGKGSKIDNGYNYLNLTVNVSKL